MKSLIVALVAVAALCVPSFAFAGGHCAVAVAQPQVLVASAFAPVAVAAAPVVVQQQAVHTPFVAANVVAVPFVAVKNHCGAVVQVNAGRQRVRSRTVVRVRSR